MSRAALAALARRHGIGLLAVALGTFAFATVMTEGAFDLTALGTHFTDFYDQLGRSMLRGRFDVPQQSIGLEAFVIDGRYYGYWGPTPALLRIPLDLLFPSMWGRWNQLIMLASCAASLLAVYALFREAGAALGGWTGRTLREQYAAAAFVLAAALASSLFFIGRRPTVYHEAIVVGAAFALASYAFLARYLATERTRSLVLCWITAMLGDLARGSVGAGPPFALTLLAAGMVVALLLPWARRSARTPPRLLELVDRSLRTFAIPRGDRLRKQTLLLIALLGLGVAAIAFRNIRTVGKITGEPSFTQHVALKDDAARLARIQGKVVHLENLRTMAYNYFRPDGIVTSPRFPWFAPRSTARVFPEAHYDNAEPYVSVTCGYTFWLVLSLLGLVVAARPGVAADATGTARLRLAIIGSALGSMGPFIHIFITLRYLHDLFPFLIITAAIGLQRLLGLYDQRGWVRALVPFVILLGLFTCLTSIAVTAASVRWT